MASSAIGFSVGAIDKASGALNSVAKSVDGLVGKLRKLDRTTATATLDADDKALQSKITAAEKRVSDLKRKIEQDTPQLDLDIAAAEAKQRKLTSDLQKLRGLKVTPEVELKIAQAEAQLGRLNTQLNTLHGKKVTPQVEADLAAAQAELAAFNGELAELDRRRVSVKVDADVDDANRKVQILDKSFGAATIRAAALARAMGSIALPGAIIAATPYIASLGASAMQAAGSLWLLPAAATAGGVAFGALSVGMAGFGDAMKELDDPEKFAEAIAKLSPAARDAANAVRGLVPAWTAMQQVVQNNLFAGVAGSMRELAGNYIPALQAGLGGAAAAMNVMIQQVVEFMNQARTVGTVNGMFGNITAAMQAMSGVGRSLVSIFIDIAAVGATFLPVLARGFAAAATSAERFISNARETGQLAVWIENGLNTIEQLSAILVNVGSILGSVFTAGAASGESFLSVLERVTDTAAEALRTPEGAAALAAFFTQIREIVGLFIDKLVIMWPAIQAAGSAFAALLTAAAPLASTLLSLVVSALVPMLNAIQWLAPVLGPLAVGFLAVNVATGTAAAAMSAWTVITKTAGVVAAVWNALLHPIATATKAWAVAQGVLNAVMAMNPITLVVLALAALAAGLYLAWTHSETFRNIVTGAFNAVGTAVSAVIGFFAGLPASIGGMLTTLGSAIASGATAAWNWLVTTATTAFNAVVAWFTGLPGQIGGLLTTLGTAIAAGATAAWNWLVTAASTAVTAAIDWLVQLPNRVAFALGFLAATLYQAAVNGWARFTTGLENAWNGTIAFFTALPGRIAVFLIGLGASIYTWAVTAWTQFTTGLENAWNTTIAFFTSLPGRIGAFLMGLGVSLMVWAITAWGQFTAGLEQAWTATIAFFTSLPGRIGAFLLGLGATLLTAAVTAWAGFTSGIETGWAATLVFLASIPVRIGAFFVGAGTWLLQVGLDLVAGLVAGVTGAWAGLMGFFGGLITSFIDGVKAAFGVASPSTIFAQIGTFLIQGLITGIQTAAAFLWTIITTIATGVVNFFMAGISGLAAMWAAVWNGVVAVFQAVWTTIQAVATTVWGALVAYFTASWAAYQAMWAAVWNGITAVFTAVWNGIRATATAVWGAISAFFAGAFAAFQAVFAAVWNAISAVFSAVWNGIRTVATTIWNAIVAFFSAAFAAYQALFQTVWTTIQTIFTTVWNFILTTAQTIWNMIVAFFTAAFATFTAFFQMVWNNIVLVFTTVWNLIYTTAMNIWNTIVAWFTAAFATWTAFFQATWDNIVAVFQVVWNFLLSTAQTMWEQIRAFFEGAWAAFTGFFQTTWDNIVGIFDRVWSSITDIAGRVWESVKGVFIDGINWVIRKINDFAGAINRVAGLLGFDINLGIAEIPRQAGGPIMARRNGGPIGLASGGGVNAATGGMLPGRNKPGRDRLPAVAGAQHYRLDGGEYVVTRDSTKTIGAAGMAAINNAKRNPVDIVPRRRGGVTHLAKGGPVLPESTVRNHRPFLSALKDGQAEAVQAANVHGGRDKFLAKLAEGDKKAEKAVGKPRQKMDGYRTQYHPSQLAPIRRDLGGAIAFAKGMSGKPYVWGGANPAVGTDCSGYQGMITRVLRNQSPARIGSTHDFPWPGFVNGLGSAYSVGSFKGSPGHMAGTLAGVNVESGGSPSRVKYGAGAAGADHGQFGIRAHLPEAGGVFASGGGGGGGGGLSFGAMARSWLDPLYRILVPIRDNAGEGLANRSGAGGGVWLMDKIVAAADALGGGGGAESAGLPVGGPVVDQVRAVANRYGWGSGPEWEALSRIIHDESGWDPNAANPNSSARGLFQKMTSIHGPVEPTAAGQAEWGLNYIRGRYGTPTAARRFWEANKHYDQGGLATGTGMMMKDVIAPERVLSTRQTRSFEQLVGALASGRPQNMVANGAVAAQMVAAQSGRARGTAVTVLSDNSDTVSAISHLQTEVAQLGTLVKEARPVNVYARNDDVSETGRSVALQMRL